MCNIYLRVPEDEQVRGDPLPVVLHGLGSGRVPLDIRDPQQGNMQPREQHLQGTGSNTVVFKVASTQDI